MSVDNQQQLLYIFVCLTSLHGTAPVQPCQEGSVRLVNGDIEQEGRVEVCIGGLWGSMCVSSWNNPSANGFVVCNQLGFRSLSSESVMATCMIY